MDEFVRRVIVLYCNPAHPWLLKITSTVPSSPGFKMVLLSLEVVHPQPGITSFTTNGAFPEFLKRNVWVTTSPWVIVPKSKKSSIYSRFGTPELLPEVLRLFLGLEGEPQVVSSSTHITTIPLVLIPEYLVIFSWTCSINLLNLQPKTAEIATSGCGCWWLLNLAWLFGIWF